MSRADRLCSLCGRLFPLSELLPQAEAFKFYTTDKPGFIQGLREKEEEEIKRNYPVCKPCNTDLEQGKKFLEEHLEFRFCGLSYYLIPSFLWDEKELKKEVFAILKEKKKATHRLHAVKDDEDEVLEEAARFQDSVSFHFLFLEVNRTTGATKILASLEDILPSRLQTLFRAKALVEDTFAALTQTDTSTFTFADLRHFFAKSEANKRSNDLDSYFLSLVSAAFMQQPVQPRFLYRFFLQRLRQEWTNKQLPFFFSSISRAQKSFLFFHSLGLFPQEPTMPLSLPSDPPCPPPLLALLGRYSPQLQTPERIGIFLLGALAQSLLDIQQKDRSAQPFAKQLQSLRMNERDIRSLLPKIQEKLRQYDKLYPSHLKALALASDFFLQAPSPWPLNTDEINFFFACGMRLSWQTLQTFRSPTDAAETTEEGAEGKDASASQRRLPLDPKLGSDADALQDKLF